jgi:ribosomal protein S18 acetylase RimI-like enzyme
MTRREQITVPQRVGDPLEIDYSAAAPDFGPLARDRIPVRSIRESDLKVLSGIDQRITGHDRRDYFERKLAEALSESDLSVSLVAELDGQPVGFIMARVDLGEFGRLEPAAVLDTIGIDPEFRGRGVGRALLTQLLVNLSSLRVDKVRTEIDWLDGDLLGFLARCGFRPATRLSFAYRLP